MDDTLRIEEREAAGVYTLVLAGELDVATAPSLAVLIDRARARRRPKVLVDLTGVGFCDSTGLRALMGAERELRIAGGRLTIVCPGDGQVARLLDVTGLREALRVYEDPRHAVAGLAG